MFFYLRNKGIDTDNALSENNVINSDGVDEVGGVGNTANVQKDNGVVNEEGKNNVINGENDIANGDGMGYKGVEEGNTLDLKRAESYTSKGLLKSIKEKGYDFERIMKIVSIDDPAKIPQQDKDYVIGIMKDIGVPKVGETIRKILPKVRLDEFLNSDKMPAGFIANLSHVEELNIFDIIHKALRLDGNKNFNIYDDTYLMYDSIVAKDDIFNIPIDEGSGKLAPPCNGLGATAGEYGIFPEYTTIGRMFNNKDNLYIMDSKTGKCISTYEYDFVEKHWIKKENK